MLNQSYSQDYSRKFAWKRFGARCVDVAFYGTIFQLIFCFVLLLLAVSGLAPQPLDFFSNAEIFFEERKTTIIPRLFYMFITCSIVIPSSYHFFGNTVGKKLLGIVIIDQKGNYLSFTKASKREIKVFFRGLFFMWFSMIYQYFAFKKNKVLSWDEELNLTVYYKNFSNLNTFIRSIFAVIIYFLVVFLYVWIINYF